MFLLSYLKSLKKSSSDQMSFFQKTSPQHLSQVHQYIYQNSFQVLTKLNTLICLIDPTFGKFSPNRYTHKVQSPTLAVPPFQAALTFWSTSISDGCPPPISVDVRMPEFLSKCRVLIEKNRFYCRCLGKKHMTGSWLKGFLTKSPHFNLKFLAE